MNYASIRKLDVSNSEGISTTVFLSGCTNNCKGCFNKELQDFNYGNLWTINIENKFLEYCKNPNVDNVCILGGEPLQQNKILMKNLIKRINNEVNKPIWMWTGLLWEDILLDNELLEIIKDIDVLVDGPFVESERDLNLKHRGSKNQRIIDVKKSLNVKEIVYYSN